MNNGIRAAICMIAFATTAPVAAQTPNISIQTEGGINNDIQVVVNKKDQYTPYPGAAPLYNNLTNRCFVPGFSAPMFLPVYGLPGTPCWVRLPYGVLHGFAG